MKNTRKIFIVFILIVSVFVVPNNVNAENIPQIFEQILNTDGKLEVNTVEPKTLEEFGVLVGEYTLYDTYGPEFMIDPSTCNSNYTVCNIEHGPTGEKYDIEIEYKYDRNIKKIFDEYLASIPNNLSNFSVRDMEVVNFWVNAKGDEILTPLYSSEIKSYFEYKNFKMDFRYGDSGEFERMAGGIANFKYKDTIYGLQNGVEISAKHIIYVPDETGDSKEELMAAAQKRIDEYLGKGIVNITEGGKGIYNYFVDGYDSDINRFQSELNIEQAKPDNEKDMGKIMSLQNEISNYTDYKQRFTDDWNNSDSYDFLKAAEGDYYFKATIPQNEGSENQFKFIIVKDSDKMFTPSHITSDISTDITINSKDSSVPLDTLISANQLTSGKEYEKIIKLLNLDDNLTFDLKLYSESLNKYITKLEDGTFEVKIPIQENLKNKTLVAYYVDENGKIETLNVDLEKEEGYAIFNTNHFSIYTLAEKTSTSAQVKPPATGDNIILYGILGLISLFGISTCTIYINKKSNKLGY